LATSEKSDFKSSKSEETDLEAKKTRQKIYVRLAHIEAKIKLMINPDESDHIKLLTAIAELKDWSRDDELSYEEATEQDEGTPSNFKKKQQIIVNISRRILKEEWEVVKAG
jgi:RecJ-like exonuclease